MPDRPKIPGSRGARAVQRILGAAARRFGGEGYDRSSLRAVAAEAGVGAGTLRSHFPMNIEARLPEVGERVLREQAPVRADLDRLLALWGDALSRSDGPMLFGGFGIADAYFAPVAMRIETYALPVPAEIGAWLARLRALPGVAGWITDALAERDFRAFEEPHRASP